MSLSSSMLQYMLACNSTFTSRLQVVMTTVANNVLTETGVGVTHAARAAYARAVITNPASIITVAALTLAQSGNVAPTITMEDTGASTSVTDAALFSQVNSSWNNLSGIDAGN